MQAAARSFYKSAEVRKHALALRPIAYCVMLACCDSAWANPTGAHVINGAVSFARPDASTLNVTNSPGSVIHWQGFSIGAGEVTRFTQQSAASAVLNRVVGADISQIHGQLLSNGRVFLINPAGIVIGAGGVIDTAGFVGSTLNMTNGDFLAGKLRFDGGTGSVRNDGMVRAAGDILLVGPSVENTGAIVSEGGSVVLAAGRSVTITSPDLDGVQFALQAPSDTAINLGSIHAKGAAGLFAGTLKHSGDTRAAGLGVDSGGRIVLHAQNDATLAAGSKLDASGVNGGSIVVKSGGTTLVSGVLDASAGAGQGGVVHVLGERVGVLDNARVDASGGAGGGTILVGGDYAGGNRAVQNARAAYLGTRATLDASARARGDGGRVIVWSDDTTRAHGTILARGGADSGDGGFVEVSGKQSLDFHAKVDVRAPNGRGGTLLLDPTDIILTGPTGGCCDLDPELTASSDPDLLFNEGVGTTLTVTELTTTNWTAGTTIRLEATNDIVMNHGPGFALPDDVNLTLVPDADASGAGAFLMQLGTITLNGGTLALASRAGSTPRMTWSGGGFASGAGGTGTLSIPTGAIVTVTGATRALGNIIVQNAGTWNMSMNNNAVMQLGSAGFNNNGVINFISGAGVTNSIGSAGSGLLNNFGAIRNNAAGIAQITNGATTMAFNNDGGTLEASSTGILRLTGFMAGSYSNTMTIAGSNVIFHQGTHVFNTGSTVNGIVNHEFDADLRFDGATRTNGMYNLAAPVGSLTVNGGTFTLAGGMNWSTGSTFTGTGLTPILSIPASATLTVTGDQRGFSNLRIDNAGTLAINMNDSQSLTLNNVVLNNSNLIDFITTNNFNSIVSAVAPSTIVNTGTVRNSSNALVQLFDGAVPATLTLTNNGGTFHDAAAGELRLEPTSATYSGTTTIRGDNVTFAGDPATTHTYNGTISATEAGSRFNLTNGIHNFENGSILDLRDNLTAIAGLATVHLNGTGSGTTIPLNATVSLPNIFDLQGPANGRLVNRGTLNLDSNAIAGIVDNQGTLNVTGTPQINGDTFAQTSGLLNLNTGATLTKNNGTFEWVGGTIGGAGTLAIDPSAVFNISGAGARVLNGPTVTADDLNLTGGSLTIQTGVFNATGDTTIGAAATLAVTGGTFDPAGGDIEIFGTFQADVPVVAGTFAVRPGGTLSGLGAVNANSLTWTGGTISGAGVKTFGQIDSGGTLALSGHVTIDTGTWTNTGALAQSGSGLVTLANNALIDNQINGAWTVTSNQPTAITGAGTFDNIGTFTHNGIFGIQVSPTTFNNGGIVNVTGAGSLILNTNGTHAGTFNATVGAVELNGNHTITAPGVLQGNGGIVFRSGTSMIAGTIQNLGAFDVLLNADVTVNGAMNNVSNMTVGGTSVVNVNTTPGITTLLQVTGGTTAFNAGANITGAFDLDGGIVSFNNATTSIGGVSTVTGGTLSGTGALQLNGALAWSGGTIAGTGALDTVNAIDITAPVSLDGRTWNNGGTAGISATGRLTLASNSVVNNQAGAVWNLTSTDATPITGAGTFNNAGTFGVSGPPAYSIDPTAFNNTGLVDVLGGGSLTIVSNGTHSGTFGVAAGSTIGFAGGAHAFGNGTMLGGAGTVSFSNGGAFDVQSGAAVDTLGTLALTGGTLTFAGGSTYTAVDSTQVGGGVLELNNAASTSGLSFTGGTIRGGGSLGLNGVGGWSGGRFEIATLGIAGGAELTLSGAGDKVADATAISNGGAIRLTGAGNLVLDNGAAVDNVGLFDIQSDAGIAHLVGPGAPVFTNRGTLHKSAGNGVSAIGVGNAFTFANNGSGTVSVTAGTLQVNGGFPQNDGTIHVGPGATFSTNGNALVNAGTLAGDGAIDLAGALLTNNALVSPGASPGALFIDGDFTQGPAGALLIELGGVAQGVTYDLLQVAGTANLGGTLDVVTTGGFVPAPGDAFTFMTYAARNGDFATLNLPAGAALQPAATPVAYALGAHGAAPPAAGATTGSTGMLQGPLPDENERLRQRLEQIVALRPLEDERPPRGSQLCR